MRPLNNQNGIALVTSLMLTLISLTIVLYLMSMITSGVKLSSASKRYKTALEASYGGAELTLKEVLPIIFTKVIGAEGNSPDNALAGLYPASLDFKTSGDTCLMEKLTKPTSQWSSACSKNSNPVNSPDFTFKLNSVGTDNFTVYTKIVDAMCSDPRPYPTGKCTGSDLSGIDYLDSGLGTSGGSSTGVSVKALPAAYRIEIRGQRTTNPLERANLSILYAY